MDFPATERTKQYSSTLGVEIGEGEVSIGWDRTMQMRGLLSLHRGHLMNPVTQIKNRTHCSFCSSGNLFFDQM